MHEIFHIIPSGKLKDLESSYTPQTLIKANLCMHEMQELKPLFDTIMY